MIFFLNKPEDVHKSYGIRDIFLIGNFYFLTKNIIP